MTVKTDNHNPTAKLALRRHFLEKYHADRPIHVMDCCQGGGLMWHTLRDEFPVASYWGLDVKPKKGRLKLDSARVLAQAGWTQNVIDIDTYGSPWKHWLAMLPNITRPTTVFLTIGRGGPNIIRLGNNELLAMGMRMPSLFKMSGAITHRLADLASRFLLAEVYKNGILIKEAIESFPQRNARYIGLHLEKANAERACNTAGILATPQP